MFLKYLHHQMTNCIQWTTGYGKFILIKIGLWKPNKPHLFINGIQGGSKIGKKLPVSCWSQNRRAQSPTSRAAARIYRLAKTPCRLMNYWWLKVFALPIVRLGNSRVLGPWAHEASQLTTYTCPDCLDGKISFSLQYF